MQKVIVPWQRWFEEKQIELAFPDQWNINFADEIIKIADIGKKGIEAAFESPIGTKALSELALRRNNAVIAIDDISRPTPTFRFINYVIQELIKGGINQSKIKIIIASGAHRQSTRQELIPKLGSSIIENYNIIHHVPYENLIDLGNTKFGTPIKTNRDFFEGDLKIAIGSIMPHPTAGFGGGRKLISVGFSSVQTLQTFHSRDEGWNRTGFINGNIQHEDLDEIMHKIGLDVVVEVILTGTSGVAALVVGDPTQCFKEGIKKAWKIYKTHMPKNNDIVFINAYPKDLDLLQACNALWVSFFPNIDIVRAGGTVVCLAACPDGEGLHYLSSYGMSDPVNFAESSFQGRDLFIYSPNLNNFDIKKHFPKNVRGFRNWEDLLKELQKKHTGIPNVLVLPCGPLHLNPENFGMGPFPVLS